MVGGGAVFDKGSAVTAGAVAGVLVPAELGVASGEAGHGAVSDDLGDDAGSGNGEGGCVSTDAALGGTADGWSAVAIDYCEIRDCGKAVDRSAHGEHGGVEDVDMEDFCNRGGADRDLDAGAADEGGIGGLPGGRRQGLAVVDEGAEAAGDAIVEDHGGRDDGTGEWPATGFIHARDPAAVGTLDSVVWSHVVW